MPDVKDKIAARAGLTRDVVDRVLAARLDFQLALGFAHGDAEDAARGAKLREKYPDLLRKSVVETAGRSAAKAVTFELEATVVQLESGATAHDVVATIAAEDEVLGVVDPSYSATYRAWGARWTSG
jgi:hypothetical protein